MSFLVILPVFNQPGFSEVAIRRLYATEAEFDLIVVDNGSLIETKLLLENLSREFGFQIKRFDRNVGWPRAINATLKAVRLEKQFVVLLQNDCFVAKTFFDRALAVIEHADPQAMVFLPKTSYSRSGLLQVSDEATQRFREQKPSNKGRPQTKDEVECLLEDVYGDLDTYADSYKYAKQLIFCSVIDSYCLIVDRAIFKEGFYFDEQYVTLGCVEKDWMEKLASAGYEPWILNNVFVHHHGNLTTDGNGYEYPVVFSHDNRLLKEKLNAS